MKNTSNIFIQSLIFSVVFAASSSVFADSFELGQIYAQPSQKGCVRDTPIGVGLTHTCFAPIANLVHATLLGFSTAEPLEISNNSWGIYFPNINQYANGCPGVYKLRIKVDIPDENGVIAESHTSDEIEIKLFSWDSVDYRFDDSCPPSITVTLNTSPEYDGNPAIVFGDTLDSEHRLRIS